MDFSYSDDAELKQLHEQVLLDPEEFEHWEKLIRAAEQQEGGLSRNSNPQAIATTRAAYDGFLDRFPLFFGYWKKYADLEFSIGGTETAEMVYERGVACVSTSVDLWANYCTFKIETSHDADVIRELFERGASAVGLDFLSHPFWDKYLEYEERLESQDRVFAILGRIVHLPLHQYARYFDRFRTMAGRRPVDELAPEAAIAQLRADIERENYGKPLNEAGIERELRTRLGNLHMDIFNRTAKETTRRWVYEAEITRPYYHVTEVEESQLVACRKYLDFEEAEGDFVRTKFMYDRCLVTLADYDEFWMRFARWTMAQKHLPEHVRNEEVRIVYNLASCKHVSISRPEIRLHWARFEESLGKTDVAIDIHEAILENLPGHLETMVSLVSTHRRQYGIDAALNILHGLLARYPSAETQAPLIAESARLTWKAKGDAEGAHNIFETHKLKFVSSPLFLAQWLDFELELPSTEKGESSRHARIKAVFDYICDNALVEQDFIKSITRTYLVYLVKRGTKDAMEEYCRIDQETFGPSSVARLKVKQENGQ